jgi:N-acetyl-anhydromuramyl-L-alanine amidase AmpD
MRQINKIIIHAADTPADMDIGAAEINQWHIKRGWSGIGYHWVIRRDGTVEQGRSESTPGAHAYGHNQDSIGICMVGGKPDCNYTAAQWRALEALVRDLLARYDCEVIGHRDVSDKPCPMFDARAWAEGLL